MSRWQLGLCVLMIPIFLAGTAQAQSYTQSSSQSSRRSVATVIFCGLGGAVVGLSTLSFYGKPQDHTGNIYAGLGLGLILGTAYVLSAPSQPSGVYEISQNEKPRLQLFEFKDLPRGSKANAMEIPIAAYSWSF